jgi:hypothetical protein
MPSVDLEVASVFLAEARREFLGCQRKIQHCVEQLNDDQLWWRAGEQYNSIANLLLHLRGNVGQRILSLVGGEADTRDRAVEFAERGPISKDELLGPLDETFQKTDQVLAGLTPEKLLETRTWKMLKGEVEGTVLTLILQTLVHVGGHAQEIIAVTRLQLREGYRFMH